MKVFHRSLIIIGFLLLCINAFAHADALVTYNISHQEVEKAWISEYSNTEFIVRLLLKEPLKQRFHELTKKNIGKRLKITIEGRTISNAEIKDEISSGVIFIGTFASKEEAEHFIKDLLK